MQIKRSIDLIAALDDTELNRITTVFVEVEDAIQVVDWPPGSGSFTMNPVRMGNGVKPIKNACVQRLVDNGWAAEYRLRISGPRPGPIDAVKILPAGDMIALEWETGNISSSHRAINKMVLGMLHRKLMGAFSSCRRGRCIAI